MKGYTVNQVAQILKTNPETVRRWIRTGKLQATQNSKKDGNIISEQALVRFLEAKPKYATIAKTIATTLPVAATSATMFPVFLGALTTALIASLSMSTTKKVVTSEYIRNYLKKEIKALEKEIANKRQIIIQLQEEVEKNEHRLNGLTSILENGDLEQIAANVNLRMKDK